MSLDPGNVNHRTPPPQKDDNLTLPISAKNSIPFPQAYVKEGAAKTLSKEIKAKVITGRHFFDGALKALKIAFITNLFARFFPEHKPKALTVRDANFRLLSDNQLAKSYGASLDNYMNREEKKNLFKDLLRLTNNLTKEEIHNLNAFISAYVLHGNPNEIELLETDSKLPNLFKFLRDRGIETREDIQLDRMRHFKSPSSGKITLIDQLDAIRKGDHPFRKEFIDLMSASITHFGKGSLANLRAGELARLNKEEIDDESESLKGILNDSYRLMEAIKGDILREDQDARGIKNSLEFYIDLAESLKNTGDANGFILVLAVLLDPDMKNVIESANLSSAHLGRLNTLEAKADEIDAFGNFSGRTVLPSIFLLIDHFKDIAQGQTGEVISDEWMTSIENTMKTIEGIQVGEAPYYNIDSFMRFHNKPSDSQKVIKKVNQDLDQIYSVLEKADLNQKLRFSPEGLVAKERSIISRFTNKLAGKKDPAKNAVQYILAKLDRALDQDPPQLEKIAPIIDFLNYHTWSKIVLNKNEPLKKALSEIEKKYLSKINKDESIQALKIKTDLGLVMIESFLSDIDDTRRLVLVRSFSGRYNLMSTQDKVSEITLNNLYRLLQDAEKFPELKIKAVGLLEKLYKTSWFEEALKHSSKGDEIIQIGRRMAQKWGTENVPP